MTEPSTILEIVVIALAVWRCSSLLANEEGPAAIIEKTRLLLGKRYNAESQPEAGNWIVAELMCQWCNSLYIGAAWAVFYWLFPRPAFFCALPFAFSTATILIMTSKGLQVFLRRLREDH